MSERSTPGAAVATVEKHAPEPAPTNGHVQPEAPPAPGSPAAQAPESQTVAAAAVAAGWNTMAPLLTTVVTGAGLLGFVALFGGAIEFARAREAGLPAGHAVALLPKSTLLATGGQFLVGAMQLALASVAGLFLLCRFLDPVTRPWVERRRDARDAKPMKAATDRVESARAAHDEALAQHESALHDLDDRRLAHESAATELAESRAQFERADKTYQATLTQAAQAQSDIELGELDDQARREAEIKVKLREATAADRELALETFEQKRKALEDAAEEVKTATGKVDSAHGRTEDLGREINDADAALAKLRDRHDRGIEGGVRGLRYAALCIVLLFGEALLLATGRGISVGHIGLLLVVSLVTSLLALFVYHQTHEKFVWFGVSVFLAIGIFQGWALNYSIKDAPKVEPAAALVAGQKPMTGAYFTQTDDRVYMGMPRPGDGGFDLIAVPRSSVVALAVGPLTDHRIAQRAADEISERLCDRQTVPGTLKALRAAPQCPTIAKALAAKSS